MMLIILFLILLLTGDVYSSTLKDSRTDDLKDWFNSRKVPRVRSHGCTMILEPPSRTDEAYGIIRIYYDRVVAEGAGLLSEKNANCIRNVNTINVYCGKTEGNFRGSVSVKPVFAATPFTLRVIRAIPVLTITNSTMDEYEIYGYYCTSTGCYGSSKTESLDGSALKDDFLLAVDVYCNGRL